MSALASVQSFPSQSFEYVARFDEGPAKLAARLFFLRSIRQLRFWGTILPPVAFLIIAIWGHIGNAPMWFTGGFAAVFALTVFAPVLFFVNHQLVAASDAREFPTRHVQVGSSGIKIKKGKKEVSLPWSQIQHVWHSEDYLILVRNPFEAIYLPKQDMPAGMSDFINTCIRGSTQEQSQTLFE